MEKRNKVLLIPDAYLGNQSGATVAKIAKKLLLENGNEVFIFSPDIVVESSENDGTKLFPRTPYRGIANWKEKKYSIEYEDVLKKTEADVVFTLGSITNKNLCYLEIAKKRNLKVISKIFMQDFFCTKFYANNIEGPCTKCLDSSYLEAFKNKCIIHKPIDYVKTANAILIRKRLEKILPKIDYVITSTDEQIGYYQKFGVSQEKCVKIPLFFDDNRLKGIKPVMGDYFVCIAQNRVEKGFQYLKDILLYCDNSIKLIVAYNSNEQANIAIEKYGFREFIENGMMEIKYDLKWETGLAELVANSKGVIIPSIWPTTTEFGLLEALGYKKPVFCFDLGVHHEKIESNVNGFVADLGDTRSMAKQLVQLNADDVLLAKVSNGAELLYQEMTDWDNWKNELKLIGL
mgnify:CR=1 FL=1|tara:strand:+ start:3033 stop:4241 length:1209 start_codon:yes stop_codon:yes gene_type:complete